MYNFIQDHELHTFEKLKGVLVLNKYARIFCLCKIFFPSSGCIIERTFYETLIM